MNKTSIPVVAAGIALSLTLSACGKRVAVQPPAANPVTAPEPAGTDQVSPAGDVPVRNNDDDRMREAAVATLRQSIQFAYDRSDLSRDAREALDAKVGVLLADRQIRIRIEGHADERGSSEYNLALGQRRAAAARRYLTSRDVAPDRIEIASFGEERPVCEDSMESCWRLNRRDEFQIIP